MSNPMDVLSEVAEEQAAELAKKRRWPRVVGAVVLAAGCAYTAAACYVADKIPIQTSVAGVKIGGMDRDAAGELLSSKIAEALKNDIAVKAGDKSLTVTPADFKATFNEKATLDSLVGFSMNPVRIWRGLAGGGEVQPVIDVDAAALTSVVDKLAAEAKLEATDATVSFEGTTPKTTPAVSGVELKKSEAEKTLKNELLSAAAIELPVDRGEPTISDADAAAAVEKLAKPLVSANLAVNVDSHTVNVTPEQLAASASFEKNGGELALKLDPTKLGDVVRAAAPDVLTAGNDARIEIVNHTTPTVIPSTDGVGIDDNDLAQKAQAAGVTSNRVISVATTKVPAKFTTEDAQKLGIKEVVSKIDTPLTNDSVRTKNLLTGTSKISNTLVKPGETFSLLTALGPITEANGFVASGVVANGFNSTAMGGGISQLSTNTFNLGYLAGLEDVEHKPHSKYFSRYPMGREATLWTGQIDMRWKNTTPYGVVIDTWVQNNRVYSQLWSTKYFDVTTSTSSPFNQVAPTSKVNTAADCEPSPAGGPGFTVRVSRVVRLNGAVVEDSGYNWTYQPVNAVTCG